jgi:hypothetical protein
MSILLTRVGTLNSVIIPNSNILWYLKLEGNGNDYKGINNANATVNASFSLAFGRVNQGVNFSGTGYINYKCNLSVLSEDYKFYVDKDVLEISELDLYGFEASLYKHWTDEFSSRRVLLSFGFVLPYHLLNRESNEPRVRLSQRIERYFQKV